MDRRLNMFFDRLSGGETKDSTIIVRNAGGCVASALGTIGTVSPAEVDCYTHTDCGAMKVARAACSELEAGKQLDDVESNAGIYDKVIAPLAGRSYSSAIEIENANTELQRASLASLSKAHPGTRCECELVDLSKMDIPKSNGRHALAIGTAFSGRYVELSERHGLDVNETYFVQANALDEVVPPALLAIDKLGLRDVMFISAAKKDNEVLQHWASSPAFSSLFNRYEISPEVMGF